MPRKQTLPFPQGKDSSTEWHCEFDEDTHRVLLIAPEYFREYMPQIDRVRRLMEGKGVLRGALLDLFMESEAANDMDYADWRYYRNVTACYAMGCVLLIPSVSSRLENKISGRLFTTMLIGSGLQFLAFDRPELTRRSLIAEIRGSGKPLAADELAVAVEQGKKWATSSKIRISLWAAADRAVKLGNPRLAEARAKAVAAHQAARPSPEVLNLMTTWRQKGKTFRQIALALNDRGIKTPRGRQWCASTVRNQLLK